MTELWDYPESDPPRKWRWSRRKAKRNRTDTPVKPPVNDVPTFPPPPEGSIDHIRQQLDEAIRDTLLKAADNPEPFLELGRALGPLSDLYDGILTGPEILRQATTEIREARQRSERLETTVLEHSRARASIPTQDAESPNPMAIVMHLIGNPPPTLASGDGYGWSGRCTAITTTPDRVQATVEWIRVPLPALQFPTRRDNPATQSDQEHP